MREIIQKLREDALNMSVAETTLLRRLLILAKDSGHGELRKWIETELKGYDESAARPSYRFVRGKVKVFHAYGGWMALTPVDETAAVQLDRLSERFIGQELGVIEEMRQGSKVFEVPFPPKIQAKLMKSNNLNLPPSLIVDKSQLVKVLDGVRNEILKWLSVLEREFPNKDRESNGRSKKRWYKKSWAYFVEALMVIAAIIAIIEYFSNDEKIVHSDRQKGSVTADKIENVFIVNKEEKVYNPKSVYYNGNVIGIAENYRVDGGMMIFTRIMSKSRKLLELKSGDIIVFMDKQCRYIKSSALAKLQGLTPEASYVLHGARCEIIE